MSPFPGGGGTAGCCPAGPRPGGWGSAGTRAASSPPGPGAHHSRQVPLETSVNTGSFSKDFFNQEAVNRYF